MGRLPELAIGVVPDGLYFAANDVHATCEIGIALGQLARAYEAEEHGANVGCKGGGLGGSGVDGGRGDREDGS